MRENLIYILGAAAAVLLVRNLYIILNVLPDEANQGAMYRIMFFHIPAVVDSVHWRLLRLLANVAYLVTGKLKYDAMQRFVYGGAAAVPVHRPDHRQDLGPHHLGHLVDLGRAAHLGARLRAAVLRIPDAAPGIDDPTQRARLSAVVFAVRLRRCPDCLVIHRVVAHAASFADGTAAGHDARAALELAGADH